MVTEFSILPYNKKLMPTNLYQADCHPTVTGGNLEEWTA